MAGADNRVAKGPHGLCRPQTAPRKSLSPKKQAAINEDPKAALSALQTAFAEQAQELAELKQELRARDGRCAELEMEIRLSLASSHAAEASHVAELNLLEGDIGKALSERRLLVEKLHQIGAVEDAIRGLYVDLTHRLASESDMPEEERCQGVTNLQSVSILAVTSKLQAACRTLLDFKRDAEEALRCRAAARDSQQQAEQVLLKQANEALTLRLQHAHEANDVRLACVCAQLEARQQSLTESHTLLAEGAAQCSALAAELERLRADNAALRKGLDASNAEGQRFEALIAQLRAQEADWQREKLAQATRLHHERFQHEEALREMRRQLSAVADVRRDNERLQRELQVAQRGAAGLQKMAIGGHMDALQRNAARLQRCLAEEQKKHQAMYNQLRRLQAARQMEVATQEELKRTIELTDKIENEESERVEKDPIYNVLANVDALHNEAKEAVFRIKQELQMPLKLQLGATR